MDNSDFLAAVLGNLAADEYGWVNAFAASPDDAPWAGRSWQNRPAQNALINSAATQNTYFCPAILHGVDKSGAFRRTKDNFKRLAALVADDANPDDLNGSVSWIIETSPGKRQIGIVINNDDPDAADLNTVDLVLQALAASGYIKADKSGNNAVRYCRLPIGSNTKPRPTGTWQVRVETSDLSNSYSLADACAVFGLNLDTIKKAAPTQAERKTPTGTDHATLIAALAADEPAERSYHDPLLKLSSKLVTAGLAPGAVVEHLRGLMLAIRPEGPAEMARWQTRYDEIPRMVSGAEKFRQPVIDDYGENICLDLTTLNQTNENVRWLVKHLIPADSMSMLFGASGTFKSFMALDVALHVATGRDWCRRKTTPGSVVYVAAEGGAGIARRVNAWHKQHNLKIADTNMRVCITPLLLTTDEDITRLKTDISELSSNPSLIVVDTLAQTFSGDENAATDISDYIRLLNTHLRAQFNATVLILHHTGHNASERPRGSSAITANLDCLIACFRPDKDVLEAQLEVVKQKDGDKIEPQMFELVRQVLGTDEDGEEISSLVAVHHDMAGILKMRLAKLTPGEEAILNVLKTNEAHEDDMKEAFKVVYPNANTFRSAWRRTITSLQEKRLIKATGVKTWKKI